MTQQLLSPTKVRRLAQKLGLPIVTVIVKPSGEADLLCMKDGTVAKLHDGGTIEPSDVRWRWIDDSDAVTP